MWFLTYKFPDLIPKRVASCGLVKQAGLPGCCHCAPGRQLGAGSERVFGGASPFTLLTIMEAHAVSEDDVPCLGPPVVPLYFLFFFGGGGFPYILK